MTNSLNIKDVNSIIDDDCVYSTTDKCGNEWVVYINDPYKLINLYGSEYGDIEYIESSGVVKYIGSPIKTRLSRDQYNRFLRKYGIRDLILDVVPNIYFDLHDCDIINDIYRYLETDNNFEKYKNILLSSSVIAQLNNGKYIKAAVNKYMENHNIKENEER